MLSVLLLLVKRTSVCIISRFA